MSYPLAPSLVRAPSCARSLRSFPSLCSVREPDVPRCLGRQVSTRPHGADKRSDSDEEQTRGNGHGDDRWEDQRQAPQALSRRGSALCVPPGSSTASPRSASPSQKDKGRFSYERPPREAASISIGASLKGSSPWLDGERAFAPSSPRHPGNPVEEISGGSFRRARELDQGVGSGNAASPLQQADLSSVEGCPDGQLMLGESHSPAAAKQVLA
jgi:hypothetical protein